MTRFYGGRCVLPLQYARLSCADFYGILNFLRVLAVTSYKNLTTNVESLEINLFTAPS